MAQLLKPTGLEPVLHKRRATAMRSLHITTREKAHSAIKTQHGHKQINKNKIFKKKKKGEKPGRIKTSREEGRERDEVGREMR